MVLPEPVGPVHSSMPSGAVTMSRYGPTTTGGMPSLSRVMSDRDLSSSRSTIFSPWTVPTTEMRTSIGRPSTMTENWPSWGRRRSTMFRSDMTFMRDEMGGPMRRGSSMASVRAPSMRNRTSTRFSCGSMWMSEARARTPWMRSRFTTWTIGAFSSTSRLTASVASKSSLVSSKAAMCSSAAASAS